MQVVNQIIGVGTVFIYDAIVSLILLKVIDIFIGLRVSRGGRARGSRSRAARRDHPVSPDTQRLGRNPAPPFPSRGPGARRGLSLFGPRVFAPAFEVCARDG